MSENSILQIQHDYRERSKSPWSVLDSCIDRVESASLGLNAVSQTCFDTARESAERSSLRWQDGEHFGSLDGIPAIIANNMGVINTPLLAGISARSNIHAASDCAAVAKMKAAGAPVIATANIDEAGFACNGQSPHTNDVFNPAFPKLGLGGASSGIAAAVSADMAVLGMGIDTMGDVRVPAALTGLVGFKPGKSLISADGCVPVSFTFDTPALIAKSVSDAFQGLAGLLGVPLDINRLPDSVKGLRLGVPWATIEQHTTPDVLAGFHRAISHLIQGGAKIVDIAFESDLLGPLSDDMRQVCCTEAGEYYGHLILGDDCPLSAGIADSLRQGMAMTDNERLLLVGRITSASDQITERLMHLDAIITPALPSLPICGRDASPHLARYMTLASVTGTPSITVPLGDLSPENAVQITADSLQERKVIGIAKWLSQNSL